MTFLFFLSVLLLPVLFYVSDGNVWSLLLAPVIPFLLGKRFLTSKGIRALRFDRECRNFSLDGIEFQATEAEYISQSHGEVQFRVRGQDFSFPRRVTAAGNFRTAFYLNPSVTSFIGGSFNSSRARAFVVVFENGILKARGENFKGELLPYSSLF